MSETSYSKIAISPAADQLLSKAYEQVNHGFEGGRVTKVDLASWLISHGANGLDESVIAEIRATHFNQVIYLENLVKRMKATGQQALGDSELNALKSMTGSKNQKRNFKLRSNQSQLEKISDLAE